jgi:hypothetical protein
MLTISRLRTLPFLPPHKRPDVITSKSGKEIVVDKVKVEDKEKILKRGQVSCLTSFFVSTSLARDGSGGLIIGDP